MEERKAFFGVMLKEWRMKNLTERLRERGREREMALKGKLK